MKKIIAFIVLFCTVLAVGAMAHSNHSSHSEFNITEEELANLSSEEKVDLAIKFLQETEEIKKLDRIPAPFRMLLGDNQINVEVENVKSFNLELKKNGEISNVSEGKSSNPDYIVRVEESVLDNIDEDTNPGKAAIEGYTNDKIRIESNSVLGSVALSITRFFV